VPADATGPTAALRLIGHRNFGPYFVGNAVSASGNWFFNLAASLLVYRQTHSAFLLGVLAFCNFVPYLLLAPWTGSAADRLDRKRLVLAMQAVSIVLSAAVAALAWVGLAPVAVVILFALGLGVANAFATPASSALIVSLVAREEVGSAVALNSMTFNLARVTGPALAALSVRALGIPATLAVNTASYVLLVVGLLLVRPAEQPRLGRGEARFRDGLRLVRDDPRLLAFLLIVAAVGFASDPVNTLSPAFAHAFGRPDTDAGYLIGAFGLGAVTAAFLVAGRARGSRRRMFATLLVLGLGMIGFSLSPWLPLAYVLLVVAGFGYLASNASATSGLQLEVEEHHRGRIMALWSVAFLGFRPFASLLDGAIAGGLGVRAAGVCLALPVLALAGVLYFLHRTHRTLTSAA
jgi:MFS family permease